MSFIKQVSQFLTGEAPRSRYWFALVVLALLTFLTLKVKILFGIFCLIGVALVGFKLLKSSQPQQKQS